jgi:hypothetical protein
MDDSDDLTRRLQTYLQHYDRYRWPGSTQARQDIAPESQTLGWRGRHPRLLEAGATVAAFAVLFVILAVAFIVGRHGATTVGGSHAVTPSGARPTATAPAPSRETTCSQLSHSADYSLFKIEVPGAVETKIACAAAITTAEAACPTARFVCAGVEPQAAEFSLISGFGTLLYPSDFAGYRDTPVWMITWSMSCQAVAEIGGRQQQLGSVYTPSGAVQTQSCRYAEFVDATTGGVLFPVILIAVPQS